MQQNRINKISPLRLLLFLLLLEIIIQIWTPNSETIKQFKITLRARDAKMHGWINICIFIFIVDVWGKQMAHLNWTRTNRVNVTMLQSNNDEPGMRFVAQQFLPRKKKVLVPDSSIFFLCYFSISYIYIFFLSESRDLSSIPGEISRPLCHFLGLAFTLGVGVGERRILCIDTDAVAACRTLPTARP